MPRYFEDWSVGDSITTPARTITEGDVVQFAQLTGDWNPIHTDVEFAKTTPYGQRLAHGLLGLSFAIGLLDRTGAFSGSVIANLGSKAGSIRSRCSSATRSASSSRSPRRGSPPTASAGSSRERSP